MCIQRNEKGQFVNIPYKTIEYRKIHSEYKNSKEVPVSALINKKR